MGNIKLALLNIKKNFKNEKELKSAFIISVVGMAINNIAFLFLWYYFGKTVGIINGWTPMDIFGLYGFNATSYGIISAFAAGISYLPSAITSGNLDKYFLTPKSILVKISTSKISTSAFGDLVFGIICFVIYAVINKFNLFKILVSIYLILLSCIIFYSFTLICMSVSFYLMDGSNISNGLYGMFISNSLYHGGAFTGVLRFIFIYIMPSLLLGAVPVEIIKQINISNVLFITGLAIFWLIISILFFYKSLKKYESNNFFGFGS